MSKNSKENFGESTPSKNRPNLPKEKEMNEFKTYKEILQKEQSSLEINSKEADALKEQLQLLTLKLQAAKEKENSEEIEKISLQLNNVQGRMIATHRKADEALSKICVSIHQINKIGSSLSTNRPEVQIRLKNLNSHFEKSQESYYDAMMQKGQISQMMRINEEELLSEMNRLFSA
jgi:hypothetical protein